MRSNRIPNTLLRALERHANHIEEFWMEEDGFQPELGDWSIWIYLRPEYESDPGLGLVHESTARDAIEALRRVQPTTAPR